MTSAAVTDDWAVLALSLLKTDIGHINFSIYRHNTLHCISSHRGTYLSSFSVSIATLSIVDSSIVSNDSLSAACSPSSSSSSSEEEDDAEEDDDELSEEEEEMLSSSLSALKASSEKHEQ